MNKCAVFIGRFNPPTIGHYYVLSKLKRYIVANKKLGIHAIPFIVIVAGEKSSLDRQTNPLIASERMAIMARQMECKGCKFIVATTAIDGFNKIREHGYEPVLIAGGDDRVDGYIDILKKYDPSIERIGFSVSRQQPSGNLSTVLQNISDHDVKIISASLAREAVRIGNLKAFNVITRTTDDRLFQKLKNRMGVKNEKSE